LILGTKLENNDLSNFEFQPRAAFVWTPNEKETVWASVSRAVRTPSLVNNDETIVLGVLGAGSSFDIIPNTGFDSEEVIAYEMGYRSIAGENLSIDISSFLNQYDKLESLRPVSLTQLQWENDQDGCSYGFEFSVNWNPTQKWKLKSGYTFLKMDLDGGDESLERRSPKNQFQVRSFYNITDKLEFNSAIYYYDNNQTENISSFVRTDAGLTWHATDDLEVGVWGQNIFDRDHQEFSPDQFFSVGGGFMQRGIYGFMKYKF